MAQRQRNCSRTADRTDRNTCRLTGRTRETARGSIVRTLSLLMVIVGAAMLLAGRYLVSESEDDGRLIAAIAVRLVIGGGVLFGAGRLASGR